MGCSKKTTKPDSLCKDCNMDENICPQDGQDHFCKYCKNDFFMDEESKKCKHKCKKCGEIWEGEISEEEGSESRSEEEGSEEEGSEEEGSYSDEESY